jgi:acid phosphatase
MSALAASMLALVGVTAAASITTSEPALAAIQAAQATTLPSSPTSDVQGVAFNRFYQIWLENTVSIRVLQCT